MASFLPCNRHVFLISKVYHKVEKQGVSEGRGEDCIWLEYFLEGSKKLATVFASGEGGTL